jgi:hypothetical protein
MPAKKKTKKPRKPGSGGARPNAGAKKGDPALKKRSKTIAMTDTEWDALDEQCGDIARGTYIANKLKLGRKNP